jgi:hypothetical protein
LGTEIALYVIKGTGTVVAPARPKGLRILRSK